jgi:hypothetical protein
LIWNDVVNFVHQAFLLNIEHKVENDILYLRITGVDDMSLARYIREEFKDIKVSTRRIEGYHLYNRKNDWIKIEKNVDTELVA